MSANARLLWCIPALLIASWLAVRSLAASPAQDRDAWGDPPGPFAVVTSEVHDPALAKLISGFAAEARRSRQ
jgi:hypothetical protein